MAAGSILALHRGNQTAAFRKCLQTTILYTSNILKHVDTPKFHCIKLSNKNFRNFVLSLSGGLSFFMCSPVCWQVCFSSDQLVCNKALLQAAGSGGDLKSQWLEMMSAYCVFLSDALLLDQFHHDHDA